MEERILMTAEFATAYLDRKSGETKKKSLIGVMLPLVAPLLVLLHMLADEVKFHQLEGYQKVVFFGGLLFSAFLWFCHNQAVKHEDEKATAAIRTIGKQSLIITDRRLYGSVKGVPFSCEHREVVRAYTAQVAGSPPVLVIKLVDGRLLSFDHVQEIQTMISCINDARTNCSGKEEDALAADPLETWEEENSPTAREEAVDRSDEASVALYDVVICSGNGSLQQIKVIREITLCDLAAAKAVFSSLPFTIAESVERTDGEELKRKLERVGLSAELCQRASI